MRRTILLFTLMAAALLVGSGVALAATVSEVEPNDSLAEAQHIDGSSFSLDFDPNIGDTGINTSTTIPHATLNGTGNDTVDWYSFTVAQAGDGVILDVDGASEFNPEGGITGFNSGVELYDSSGQRLPAPDYEDQRYGQGGSVTDHDSYLEHTFQTPGTYYVAVSRFCCLNPIPAVDSTGAATSYQLQISLGEFPFRCLGQLPTIQAKSGRSVKGTSGDDIIAGTQGPDTINGNGGNDIICARDGTNNVNGGDGDDQIDSGSSNDSLSGGDGVDTIIGREGNDSLSGGPGDDFMLGEDGNDRITGDRGSDQLIGWVGDDTLNGGLGPDYINGGDGTDKCSLGEIGRDECELAFGPNVNP